MNAKLALASLVLASLSACGGGGSDAPAPIVSPEGYYVDSLTSPTVGTLVEDDGTFWAFSGTGLINGQVTHDGSTLVGAGYDFVTAVGVTVHGSYVPKQSLAAVVAEGSTSRSYALLYNAQFDAPWTVSAGTHPSIDGGGFATVQANGDFSGVQGACSYTGTLVPTGKAYEKVLLKVGPECGGATAAGIAITDATEILVLARTPADTLIMVQLR